MSSIYDRDYGQLVVDNLPPDKRVTNDGVTQNKMVNWLKALVASAVQWLHDLVYNDYRSGATYSAWSSTTTYNLNDIVNYKNAIYQSLSGSNLNNTPGPTSAYWMLRQSNFIGVEERILYNGQTIILTAALNKWFGGTFRQPPSTSDIYISMVAPSVQTFVVAPSDAGSSAVGTVSSSGFIGNTTVINSATNMIINVPTALMSTITGGSNSIRKFANQYIAAGITYTIQTY